MLEVGGDEGGSITLWEATVRSICPNDTDAFFSERHAISIGC